MSTLMRISKYIIAKYLVRLLIAVICVLFVATMATVSLVSVDLSIFFSSLPSSLCLSYETP